MKSLVLTLFLVTSISLEGAAAAAQDAPPSYDASELATLLASGNPFYFTTTDRPVVEGALHIATDYVIETKILSHRFLESSLKPIAPEDTTILLKILPEISIDTFFMQSKPRATLPPKITLIIAGRACLVSSESLRSIGVGECYHLLKAGPDTCPFTLPSSAGSGKRSRLYVSEIRAAYSAYVSTTLEQHLTAYRNIAGLTAHPVIELTPATT